MGYEFNRKSLDNKLDEIESSDDDKLQEFAFEISRQMPIELNFMHNASYSNNLEANPLDAGLWVKSAGSLNEFGKYEDAAIHSTIGLRLDSKNSEGWREKGFAFYNLGELDKAMGCYNIALELNKHDGSLLHKKGVLHYKQGAYYEAINLLGDALKELPESAEIYLSLSKAWHSSRNSYKAMENCNKALELRQNYVAAMKFKATIFYSLKNEAKYKECLEIAKNMETELGY